MAGEIEERSEQDSYVPKIYVNYGNYMYLR